MRSMSEVGVGCPLATEPKRTTETRLSPSRIFAASAYWRASSRRRAPSSLIPIPPAT